MLRYTAPRRHSFDDANLRVPNFCCLPKGLINMGLSMTGSGFMRYDLRQIGERFRTLLR